MYGTFVVAKIVAVLARWLSARQRLCEGETQHVEVIRDGVQVSPGGGWVYGEVEAVHFTHQVRRREDQAARLRAELVWATERLCTGFADDEWEACLPQIASLLSESSPRTWRPLASPATLRCLDGAALALRDELLRRSHREPGLGVQASWLFEDCAEASETKDEDTTWPRSLAIHALHAAAQHSYHQPPLGSPLDAVPEQQQQQQPSSYTNYYYDDDDNANNNNKNNNGGLALPHATSRRRGGEVQQHAHKPTTEDSVTLVGALVRLSEHLARIDRSKRREKWLLRPHLDRLNAWLEERSHGSVDHERGVWVPLSPLASGKQVRVLRLHVESCEVMPSRARAPTLIYCEAIESRLPRSSRNHHVPPGFLAVKGDNGTSSSPPPEGGGLSLEDRGSRARPPRKAPLDDDDAPPTRQGDGAHGSSTSFAREQEAWTQHGHDRTHGLFDEGGELRRRLRRAVYAPADWATREAWLRRTSPDSHLEGWRLASFLVKADDDLRREQFAMQVVGLCKELFAAEGVESAWLRPYAIVCAGPRAGLVEAVADAKSIDFIKQQLQGLDQATTVSRFFEVTYGDPGSAAHTAAARNFARSLAAYSLLCYALDVKDRHNGNILIDAEGHLIHIDFGYMLGDSPGSLGFETAPFKLTEDYVNLMGGVGSETWDLFAVTFARCLHALHANHPILKALLVLSGESQEAADALSRRFADLDGDPRTTAHVATRLIHAAANSERTRRYDTFQWFQNRIMV